MVSSVFGLRPGQVRRALESACRAPSLLNSQPWAFLLAEDRLEVHLDIRRLLPAADPERRQAFIACGGALLNLRLALADDGVESDVRVWPDGPGGPLARITRSGIARPNRSRTALGHAIGHRHSNRRPFFAAPVPVNFQEVLSRNASAEGASLHLIAQPGWLDRVRHWATDAHGSQLADPAWVRERARWVAERAAEAGTSARESETTRWGSGSVDPMLTAIDDGADSGEHPLIGILTTVTDGARRQVAAGQALERTLLAATGLGLSMSTLPELIEIPRARRRLQQLLSTPDFPQAVVRLGFDGPVRPSRRRPVEDCLIEVPLATADR